MRLAPALALLTLALSTAAAPTAALAASFDCAKARAADEKAICAYRPLNDQDVRLDLLYDIHRHTLAMGGRGALEDDQREWLRQRHQCRANRACLVRAYDQRVGALQTGLQRIYSNGPF